MMKAVNFKQRMSLLLGIAILLLACNMPFVSKSDAQVEYTDLMSEEYLTAVAEFRAMPGDQRAQDMAALNQLSGERVYESYMPPTAPHEAECDPAYPQGSNVAMTYQYQPDASDILNDKLILTDASGTQTYRRELSLNANRFCRYPADNARIYECITVSDNGFQRQVFQVEGRKLCYTQVYTTSQTVAGDLPAEQPAQSDNQQPQNCDSITSLDIKVEITEEYVHNDENSGEVEEIYCEYVIHYTNTSNRPVVPFVYDLYKYEDKVENKWIRYAILEPGQSRDYQAYIQEYPNSLKHPKFVHIGEWLGAYDAGTACSDIANDDPWKERHSLPIPSPCMVISP
jgi:hypothetical protein